MCEEQLNALPKFLPLNLYYSSLSYKERVSHRDSSLAARRFKSDLVTTPCKESVLSRLFHMKLYLKKEYLQVTGSFEERAARYVLDSLAKPSIENGIILASEGSSGLAFCYHGLKMNIPVAVVFPYMTSARIIQECQKYNARIIIAGTNYEESKEWAKYVAKIENLLYFNRNDHPNIIAANGSIGIEILDQVQKPDVILVPCCNDTLLNGIAMVVKSLSPKTKIFGVKSDKIKILPIYLVEWRDKIQVGDEKFTHTMNLFDKIIEVSEEWIALAVLKLMQEEKCIVTGNGALGIAAIMSGELKRFAGKKVVVVLSDCNIATLALSRYMQQAMAAAGRLLAIDCTVNRDPRRLLDTCEIVADRNATINDITRNQDWEGGKNDNDKLKIVCVTQSFDQSCDLQERLKKHLENVSFPDVPNLTTKSTLV